MAPKGPKRAPRPTNDSKPVPAPGRRPLPKGSAKTGVKGARRIGEIFAMNPNDLVIVEDPLHPLCHQKANAKSLNPIYVASIKLDGVLETIKVVKDGEQYLVSEGRQRTKSAREVWRQQAEAGVPLEDRIEVPVQRVRAPMKVAAAQADAIQTIRRVEDWAEKAEKAHRAIHILNQDITNVAVRFGVDVRTIQNWIKIYESEELREAVSRDEIRLVDALKLTSLSQEEQQRRVAKLSGHRARRPTDDNGRIKKITAKVRAGQIETGLTFHERVLVDWILGRSTDDELLREYPALKERIHGAASNKSSSASAPSPSAAA